MENFDTNQIHRCHVYTDMTTLRKKSHKDIIYPHNKEPATAQIKFLKFPLVCTLHLNLTIGTEYKVENCTSQGPWKVMAIEYFIDLVMWHWCVFHRRVLMTSVIIKVVSPFSFNSSCQDVASRVKMIASLYAMSVQSSVPRNN